MLSCLKRWLKASDIRRWVRGCAVCSRVYTPMDWLCTSCFKQLKKFYLPPKDMIRVQNEWGHFRLLDWTENNNFFVRSFLKSLKKNAPWFLFRKLSYELFCRIVQVRSFPSDTLLIPAPPEKEGLKDHAFRLAFGLSELTGFEVRTPLIRDQKAGTSPQKQKTKRERIKTHLRLKEPFSARHCIFVDDVLTTGSTAYAAYKALQQPEFFMICTLVFRPLFFNPQRKGSVT